jgi:membrane fusion protein (multidrug efflux system)
MKRMTHPPSSSPGARGRIAGRAAALALASVLVTLAAACDRRPPAAARAPQPEVGVAAVRSERVVLTTELPGRTAAYLVAEVRPQVNGIIQRREFIEGGDVRAGDLLYQIDPAPYQAAYDEAVASRRATCPRCGRRPTG